MAGVTAVEQIVMKLTPVSIQVSQRYRQSGLVNYVGNQGLVAGIICSLQGKIIFCLRFQSGDLHGLQLPAAVRERYTVCHYNSVCEIIRGYRFQ